MAEAKTQVDGISDNTKELLGGLRNILSSEGVDNGNYIDLKAEIEKAVCELVVVGD